MRRAAKTILLSLCLGSLWPAAAVLGHAELLSATPGPGEAIAAVPPQLVARFSQDLRADRTSIELRDSEGRVIARGGKDPARSRVQRMDLPELAAGDYEVRWVTFSAQDGELGRGRYRFVVMEPAGSPVPSPSPEPAPCPSSVPGILPGSSPSPSPGDGAPVAPTGEPDTDGTTEPSPVASTRPDPCAGPSPTSVPAASPAPAGSPSASPLS